MDSEAEDVGALRALGVVKSGAEEGAIRKCFDGVNALDMTVSQVSITPDASGKAVKVRFTRKDRDKSGGSPAYTVTYRLVRRGSSVVQTETLPDRLATLTATPGAC